MILISIASSVLYLSVHVFRLLLVETIMFFEQFNNIAIISINNFFLSGDVMAWGLGPCWWGLGTAVVAAAHSAQRCSGEQGCAVEETDKLP